MPRLEIEALRHAVAGPFTFSIEAGECVGLSGPSGAGKTLLLRAIVDLDPHEGEARLDGTRAEDIRAPQWRRRVAFLPAESAWWDETVGPHFNPGFGANMKASGGARVESFDAKAGGPLRFLLERLGFPPDVLSWEISRLSTGERQRLALARLLIHHPDALLLDEPTAALDPENALRVESIIAEYRREHGAPVIWVAHDAAQLGRVADRAYRLSSGSLVSEALHGEPVP